MVAPAFGGTRFLRSVGDPTTCRQRPRKAVQVRQDSRAIRLGACPCAGISSPLTRWLAQARQAFQRDEQACYDSTTMELASRVRCGELCAAADARRSQKHRRGRKRGRQAASTRRGPWSNPVYRGLQTRNGNRAPTRQADARFLHGYLVRLLSRHGQRSILPGCRRQLIRAVYLRPGRCRPRIRRLPRVPHPRLSNNSVPFSARLAAEPRYRQAARPPTGDGNASRAASCCPPGG